MNAGSDLVFVDTNVLLYEVDTTDISKQSTAHRWIESLWLHGNARVSWQVLDEFYANAVGKLGAPALIIRRLVDTYTLWEPSEFTFPLIQRAWHWTDHARLNYWGALILAAAERSGCRWLLSEDFAHKRKYGSVEAINPFLLEPNGLGATPAT